MLSIALIWLLIVESIKGCAPQMTTDQINVTVKSFVHPCGHTVPRCCPQSAWNTPTATHLPPVVARHCCCVTYFCIGLRLLPGEKELRLKMAFSIRKVCSVVRICQWDSGEAGYVGSVASLCAVLRSKVCIVFEGLISLSLCTHIPLRSSQMETKQWGQTDLERELPTRPVNFVTPGHPT